MAKQGKHGIAWTEETWNPTRGCTRVSEGCRNCYAERRAARFSVSSKDYEGTFQRPAPFAGFAVMTASGPRWTGKVELIPERLEDPLHWRRPRRVFVDSMSDLFHEALPDEAIDRVFAVMALCPQHQFQVLTKRHERMLKYFSAGAQRIEGVSENRRAHVMYETACWHLAGGRFGEDLPSPPPWPLPNVWLGVSVEDQATADERIPLLLQTPAAVRFVSYEPALGSVELDPWLTERPGCEGEHAQSDCEECWWQCNHLDWIIVGGESGPHARPFNISWARSVVEQCRAAGVPCFVKQLGARPVSDDSADLAWLINVTGKADDPTQWPKDLRVRDFPVERLHNGK